MTFRIDQVRCHGGEWRFMINGINGAGVYGTLMTDGDGRGLYLVESDPPATPAKVATLLRLDDFFLPPGATEEQARHLLAASLERLGWGPEVDQRNRLVGAVASEEFTTPFGAVTSPAKQANCDHEWQPDGQTLTAVRWTCSKCFKTEMR